MRQDGEFKQSKTRMGCVCVCVYVCEYIYIYMEANGSCRMKNTEVKNRDFPGDPVVGNLPAIAGYAGWIPGLGGF